MLNGNEDGEKVRKKKGTEGEKVGGARKACKRLSERENREERRVPAHRGENTQTKGSFMGGGKKGRWNGGMKEGGVYGGI